jgi:two-component system sensor histidine kinase HydH
MNRRELSDLVHFGRIPRRIQQEAKLQEVHSEQMAANGVMWNRQLQLALIFAFIATLGLLTYTIPDTKVQIHNTLHHLFFVPLMAAGFLFSWKVAGLATASAYIAHSPNFFANWPVNPTRAVDNIVELAIFGTAAMVTGVIAARERRQRLKVESTKQELEKVYRELQENVEQLKRAERLSAVGQLAAGLAHEIRNPLASIAGAAGLLMRAHGSAEDSVECLEIIRVESQRLSRLLSSFLEFARPRSLKPRLIEVAPLVESVLSLAAHNATASRVELRHSIVPDLPDVQCDPELLKQVLLNLVLNAIQASPVGGVVEMCAWTEGSSLIVEVRDQGRGIPEHLRERIFEPFFTTRENGTGLGLAIAAKIIDQHHGSLTAVGHSTDGAVLRVTLPIHEGEQG